MQGLTLTEACARDSELDVVPAVITTSSGVAAVVDTEAVCDVLHPGATVSV